MRLKKSHCGPVPISIEGKEIGQIVSHFSRWKWQNCLGSGPIGRPVQQRITLSHEFSATALKGGASGPIIRAVSDRARSSLLEAILKSNVGLRLSSVTTIGLGPIGGLSVGWRFFKQLEVTVGLMFIRV